MHVMEVIADALKREGVSQLFCFPTTPLTEAAVAAGIRLVVCRQERAGVNMADGYARVTNGRPPGVFAMQYGPGLENAFGGIATAFADSSPVLFLPLGHPRETSQLLFKATRSCASVTKSVEEISVPEQVVNVMRRAFSNLKNGRPGPVMVETPRDIGGMQLAQDLVHYRPVRSVKAAADPADVEEAAQLLVEAACPLVIAGQGVLYAEASTELQQLAELLQAPVMTSVAGKSAFPEDHALSVGIAGRVINAAGHYFLEKADAVLGIGTSMTRYRLMNPSLRPGKKIIHATNDPRDLFKGYDTEIPILGDARLVLAQLNQAVRDRLGRKPRSNAVPADIKRIRGEWLEKWRQKLASNETPINPYRVIHEFSRAVDGAAAIVTHDSGSPRDYLLPFFKATRPRSYLGWGKSHGLGTGLGLAIGAKIAAPEKLCVHFMGDAAFGMTGLDFETAVRCGAPILTVVLNNSTMSNEHPHMRLSQRVQQSCDLGGNYADIARDLGGWSERVVDPAQVREAFLRARRQTEQGRPALLEFITAAEQEFSLNPSFSEGYSGN